MKECQDECHSNQYVDEKLCLDVHCADRTDGSNKTFSANGECVDKCNDEYPFVELSGRECVSTCGELYSSNGVCQESCSQYELVNGEKICQDTDCSEFYIQEDNVRQCVQQCPNSQKAYNKECSDKWCCGESTCTEHKFLTDGVCYDTCSGYVTSETDLTCTDVACSHYKLDESHNRICVDESKCNYKIERGENQYECIDECPMGYNIYGNLCTLNSCASFGLYSEGNHCV